MPLLYQVLCDTSVIRSMLYEWRYVNNRKIIMENKNVAIKDKRGTLQEIVN